MPTNIEQQSVLILSQITGLISNEEFKESQKDRIVPTANIVIIPYRLAAMNIDSPMINAAIGI